MDTEADSRSSERLLHELQVHQIELETQNESLRQAQVELAASRDRYLDLYEFAPVGYLTLTATGLIDAINLTGALLLGEEHRRLIGRRFGALVAPADGERWHRQFLHALGHGHPQSCEVTLLRGDGGRFDARLEFLPVAATTHEQRTVRAALIDITERKQLEARLLEAEARSRAIFEGTLDGICLADPATKRCVDGNPALLRMLGYRHEEFVRLGVADLHPPRDLPHVIAQFEAQLRGDIPLAVDIPVLRKDGSVFHADINAAPIQLDGKTLLLGIFRDTTGRGRKAG